MLLSYSNGYKCFCHTIEQSEKRRWGMVWGKKKTGKKNPPLDASGKTSCALHCLLSPAHRSARTTLWQPFKGMYFCIHAVESKIIVKKKKKSALWAALWDWPLPEIGPMEDFTPHGSVSSGESKLLQQKWPFLCSIRVKNMHGNMCILSQSFSLSLFLSLKKTYWERANVSVWEEPLYMTQQITTQSSRDKSVFFRTQTMRYTTGGLSSFVHKSNRLLSAPNRLHWLPFQCELLPHQKPRTACPPPPPPKIIGVG